MFYNLHGTSLLSREVSGRILYCELVQTILAPLAVVVCHIVDNSRQQEDLHLVGTSSFCLVQYVYQLKKITLGKPFAYSGLVRVREFDRAY